MNKTCDKKIHFYIIASICLVALTEIPRKKKQKKTNKLESYYLKPLQTRRSAKNSELYLALRDLKWQDIVRIEKTGISQKIADPLIVAMIDQV